MSSVKEDLVAARKELASIGSHNESKVRFSFVF